jgi:hypothetical protein
VADNVAKRSGWITFAGVIAVIASAYNTLSGIAALADDDTLAAEPNEVLYGIDLTAWGWFWLIVGVQQLLTAVLILQRSEWRLWLGVGFACVSAFVTVFVMFVFPLWAIAVLALDFLILCGLLTRSDEFTGRRFRACRCSAGPTPDLRRTSDRGPSCYPWLAASSASGAASVPRAPRCSGLVGRKVAAARPTRAKAARTTIART